MFNDLQPNEINAWSLNDTRDGLIYKPTEDLIQAYQDLFTRIFPDLNLDTSTPQGQLIEDLVNKDTQTLKLIQDIANSFFNGGSGRWLDNTLWLNFRLNRKKEIPSFAVITIEGKPLVTIESGFQIGDGNNIFTLEGRILIPQSGKTTANFRGGMEQVKANTLTNILTPLEGVYRVTNENQSTQPVFEETDTQFYQRALQYQSISNSATLNSISSYIYQLNGVEKIASYENFNNATITYRGTTFDPHSFGIVVKGGVDNDIAQAIQDKKAPGPAMMGNVEIVLPDPMSEKVFYTYKFFRPETQEIFFDISIKLYPNSPSNYESTIKNALIDFIGSKEIGGTITQGECVSNILSYLQGSIEVDDFKLGATKDTMGYSPVELDFLKEAYTNSDDIVITAKVFDINKSNIYSKNLKVSK